MRGLDLTTSAGQQGGEFCARQTCGESRVCHGLAEELDAAFPQRAVGWRKGTMLVQGLARGKHSMNISSSPSAGPAGEFDSLGVYQARALTVSELTTSSWPSEGVAVPPTAASTPSDVCSAPSSHTQPKATGQTVLGGHLASFLPSLSSSPPLFLSPKALHAVCSLFLFVPHSSRRHHHHPDTHPHVPLHRQFFLTPLFFSFPLISRRCLPLSFFSVHFSCALRKRIRVDMF